MRARHLEGREGGRVRMGCPFPSVFNLSTLRSFQMGGGLLDRGVERPPRVWCLNGDGFRSTSIFFLQLDFCKRQLEGWIRISQCCCL
jgi:hypothetical protein